MSLDSLSALKPDGARRIYEAEYTLAENDTWRDNPLIEALPGILTDDEFARAVRFFPPQSPELREHPKHLRLMYIQRALQFFTPMENHLLLQQRVARVIRDGYVARNPIKDLGWNRLHQQLDELAEKLKYGVAPHEPPSALGFSIIGIGGIGKTIGMNAIMRTYPQMLIHKTYTDSFGRDHSLTRSQIVFLKLDCPNDGTLKSLCLNFFQAVDRMTGCTRYYYKYGFKGSKQRTATEMLPDMARVAALQSIGLLIIDEIQYLSKQKSGGQEQMLHWFTELVNTIKLPVILIGTPRAEEILNAAFWQMRRNAGQGEGDWRRMTQGGEWNRFLRSLWRYQFVQKPSELETGVDAKGEKTKGVPQDMNDALYEESQGIADFAVKMFMIAQERAINTGLEQLTPDLVRIVAMDAFGKAREIIQAIKTNDPNILAKVDDVKFDVERAREEANKKKKSAHIRSEASANHAAPPVAPRSAGVAPTPVLTSLVENALTRGIYGGDALSEAGYVRSPLEFGV